MANPQNNRVPSGWQFLDEHFGGVFENEPVLLCGPAKSGKTSAALRWALEGLNQNEPTLFFTSSNARTVYETAMRLHLPITSAIDNGSLTLIEFSATDSRFTAAELAGQRVAQIHTMIQQKNVRRLAVDSLLPWIIPESPKIVAHLITEMMTKIQSLKATGLYTLPRPNSSPAIELLHLLQDQSPVCLTLIPQSDADIPLAEIVRYSGREGLPLVYPVKIVPDEIMVMATPTGTPEPPSTPGGDDNPDDKERKKGIRFSDEIL